MPKDDKKSVGKAQTALVATAATADNSATASTKMTRLKALEILGLPKNADPSQIRLPIFLSRSADVKSRKLFACEKRV